jgi:hypothetical protein
MYTEDVVARSIAYDNRSVTQYITTLSEVEKRHRVRKEDIEEAVSAGRLNSVSGNTTHFRSVDVAGFIEDSYPCDFVQYTDPGVFLFPQILSEDQVQRIRLACLYQFTNYEGKSFRYHESLSKEIVPWRIDDVAEYDTNFLWVLGSDFIHDVGLTLFGSTPWMIYNVYIVFRHKKSYPIYPHRDATWVRHRRPNAPAFYVSFCLDDSLFTDGGLYFLENSHHLVNGHVPEIVNSLEGMINIRTHPGTAVLHCGGVVHATHPEAVIQNRVSLYVAFASQDAVRDLFYWNDAPSTYHNAEFIEKKILRNEQLLLCGREIYKSSKGLV